MSLSANIDPRLWASLQNAYEAGNFTSAILDSIHFLSELIRNKSGFDSDGNNLVGAAFGGPNPIIKVNVLHTETQKDEQRGTEQLLRGLYTAIRNPRSHEKRTDTREVADVIISFVNYLVGVIDKSRSPFDKQDIVERVFDKHFAHTDQYADLLVARIPQRKRLEVLIEVFERRALDNGKSVVLFVKAALQTLDEEERETFWQIVSEALENASSDDEFRTAIQIAKHEWPKVSEIARLRTEHRLIRSIRVGEYDSARDVCFKGSLGTLAVSFASDFILRRELILAISGRLGNDDPDARAYSLTFFMYTLVELSPTPPDFVVSILKQRLSEHDGDVHSALGFLDYENLDNDWVKHLGDAYKSFKSPASITDDDIPF